MRHVDRVASLDLNASVLCQLLDVLFGHSSRIETFNVVAVLWVLVPISVQTYIDHVDRVDREKDGQACVCHHFTEHRRCYAIE